MKPGFFWKVSDVELERDRQELAEVDETTKRAFRWSLQFQYGMEIGNHPDYHDLDTGMIAEIAGLVADRYMIDAEEVHEDFWHTVEECRALPLGHPMKRVFWGNLRFQYSMTIGSHPRFSDLTPEIVVEIAGLIADRYMIDAEEVHEDFWHTVEECAKPVR